MSENAVKVTCEETRYVGTTLYKAGARYEIPAEMAGKYREYFRPVSADDAQAAERAWQQRLDQMEADAEIQRYLDHVDPSLVKAAVAAIQGEIAAAAQARVFASAQAAAAPIASAEAAHAGKASARS